MIGKKKLWVKIVIIILLVIGALFAGFPILWMILNSFKPNSEIFAWPPTWISKNFSLDAYKAVLTDPEKVRFFVNSYVIALTVVVITLVIGILASYAFSRFNFRGQKHDQYHYRRSTGNPADYAADTVLKPDRYDQAVQYILGIDSYVSDIYAAVCHSDDDGVF